MARRALSVFYLLTSLLVASAQYTATFINPPNRASNAVLDPKNNPVYSVGNALRITWTTNAPLVSLTIWQDVSDKVLKYLPDSKAINGTSFDWNPIAINGANGQPLMDLLHGNVFHFDLYNVGDTSALALSTWFNLTNDTVDARGSLISTSLPKTSSPTSSLSTSTATATPASSDLGSGAKVGIGVGVGVGVGVPLLCAIAIGFFFCNRRRRNRQQNYPPPIIDPYSAQAHYKPGGEYFAHHQQGVVSSDHMAEMDGASYPPRPVELPTRGASGRK